MIPLSTIVLSTLFFSLAAVDVVLASIRVNRTIDDQRGDNVTGYVPLYFPNEDWNIGQTCTICAICSGDPIDPTQVFDGTWHDTTYLPGNDAERIILISFTGHAVYVFNMVVNIIIPGGVVTTTDLAFYIDNDYMASFSHSPPSNNSQPSVFYNKLVYSNDSLEQGEHTLQIRSSGNTKALTLFDYVVYSTFEDEAQPSPSSQLISELRFPTQSCDSVSVSSLPAFLCTTPLLGPQVPRKRSHNIGSIVASVMGVVAFVLVYTFILRYCYLRSCQPRYVHHCHGSRPINVRIYSILDALSNRTLF
ncbi:hypothetical protein C8Q70DRAFT_117251 [Cubamyces menziesii]|nr:hypothetical protein C8Q70DRAFT_117251 [Cubamyces menziesii]